MESITELPFTLGALGAAYAGGLDPARVMREVGRRLAAVDDPGIFIDRVPARGRSRRWRRRSGPTTRRGRSGACPSRSRTISTSPGCRRRRAARPSPTCRRRTPSWWRGCAPPGRSRSARPTSTSSRPGSWACGRLTRCRGTRSTRRIVPGGSSSGSAVAVAHGAVSFSLGTDTAGSGRVPAGLNNIVGLKPTLGALSARGVVPACRTLDTVSVFALTVDDAWTAFRAAAGFDADDPYSRTGAGRRARRGAAGTDDRRAVAREPAVLRRRRAGGGVRGDGARRWRRAAPGSRRSTSRRSTRWRRCSTPAPGWRSGTRWSGRCWRATPTRCIR